MGFTFNKLLSWLYLKKYKISELLNLKNSYFSLFLMHIYEFYSILYKFTIKVKYFENYVFYFITKYGLNRCILSELHLYALSI